MVTGIAGSSTMTSTVATAGSMPSHAKEAPIKSDRRSNKPIMEKRRRARINNCLNELKTLILDYSKKDPARHSKLEKADILEKTVKHLQELQRQQAAMQQASDPKNLNKFKAGFTECANEVSRFPGLEPAVKRRLLQHLSNCINGVKTELHHHHHQQQQQQQQQLLQQQQQQQLTMQQQQLHHVNATHTHMLPSPPSSPEQDPHSLHQQQMQQHMVSAAAVAAHPYIMSAHIKQTPNGYFLPNGLQVIPTKLPNGSIALVLPQSMPQQHQLHQQQQPMQQMQQMPVNQSAMLMSMPQRTASTGSASSHSSAGYELTMAASPSASSSASCNNSMHYAPPSPANSYEAMDCKPSVIQHCSQPQPQQPSQQPLSLVMKKNIKEEDQPWRPW